MSGEIGLRELIQKVKDELYTRVQDDPNPAFFVEGVDLELAVTYRVEASGGVKIYVVDVGAGGSREKTNTIQVHLRPLLSREALQRLIDQDPTLQQRIDATALSTQIKGELILGDD